MVSISRSIGKDLHLHQSDSNARSSCWGCCHLGNAWQRQITFKDEAILPPWSSRMREVALMGLLTLSKKIHITMHPKPPGQQGKTRARAWLAPFDKKQSWKRMLYKLLENFTCVQSWKHKSGAEQKMSPLFSSCRPMGLRAMPFPSHLSSDAEKTQAHVHGLHNC